MINGVQTKSILCNRISELRRQKGITQTDLGKRVGLTKASISKIETGASGLTAYCAAMICKVLDCKFEDCFIVF